MELLTWQAGHTPQGDRPLTELPAVQDGCLADPIGILSGCALDLYRLLNGFISIDLGWDPCLTSCRTLQAKSQDRINKSTASIFGSDMLRKKGSAKGAGAQAHSSVGRTPPRRMVPFHVHVCHTGARTAGLRGICGELYCGRRGPSPPRSGRRRATAPRGEAGSAATHRATGGAPRQGRTAGRGAAAGARRDTSGHGRVPRPRPG